MRRRWGVTKRSLRGGLAHPCGTFAGLGKRYAGDGGGPTFTDICATRYALRLTFQASAPTLITSPSRKTARVTGAPFTSVAALLVSDWTQ